MEIAELICKALPHAFMRLRFVNSGTEATMSAIRLARAATGRKRILKFEGCYHGHADALLVGAGSGVATLGIPGSPGVPEEFAQLTIQAPYNDLAAWPRRSSATARRSPAFIVEPVAGNMGCVPPVPGFLAGLRELCDRAWRAADLRRGDDRLPGGLGRRPAPLPDPKPDLTCLGKVVGGGLAGRGLRRPPGSDEADRAGGTGLSGGHPLGEPPGHGGGAGDAEAALGARGSTTTLEERGRS